MAEAVKSSKTKQVKNESKNRTIEREEEIEEEITDKSLEKRLKSLTSFINNLDPTQESIEESNKHEEAKNDELNDVNKVDEPSQSNDNYYKMIEETVNVKQKEEKSFDRLNELLDNLKSNEETEMINMSPLQGEVALAESAPPIEETIQQPPSIFTANRIMDFNLDKIKKLNKLHYPRLSWNKANEEVEQDERLNDLNELNESNTSMPTLALVNNSTRKRNEIIESELMRFFERDQLCKELEVYYKSKQIQCEYFEGFLDAFIRTHSNLNEFTLDHRKHEFYELLKDYYEARMLVNKCIRHVNEFKWECIANQMRKIWSFEKYTIESFGTCADQQRCKHELKSEKAYLNRVELSKMQQMLYDLRFNLIKTGLVSSQFCSKLAKCKLESYIHNFLLKFNSQNDLNDLNYYQNVNHQLKQLIDILFYFNRKQMKPSLNVLDNKNSNKSQRKSSKQLNANETNNYYEIDDNVKENENETAIATTTTTPNAEAAKCDEDLDNDDNGNGACDELFKQNITEWLKILCCLLLNESEKRRSMSLLNQQLSFLHFENVFYILQHLFRSPQHYALNFSYLFQFPLLIPGESEALFKNLNLNSSQSDPLINFYFDSYLKIIASFSYDIKYRSQFLFINKQPKQQAKEETDESQKNSSSSWQLVDLDGDLESIESVLIEINEDDLIKLYYQIPFNRIYKFLFEYLNFQMETSQNMGPSAPQLIPVNSNSTNKNSNEFRKRYVAMKILSFLDYLSRLSIRSLIIYNRLKYKNFSKLVGKTLREAIKFVSLISLSTSKQLHQHCDHFIKRIFTTIIYSPRVKSIRWTILSYLNLNTLSLKTKWLILSIMCGIDVFHHNFESLYNDTSLNYQQNNDLKPKQKDYIVQACQNDLENILTSSKESSNGIANGNGDGGDIFKSPHKLADIELLSYMRTLHFLIDLSHNEQLGENEDLMEDESNRFNENELKTDENSELIEDEDELYEFMTCVVKIIFKIAYCFESTKEICYKEGNALLFAVCSAYPKLIGQVLTEIDTELNFIGKRSLYLCNELPFKKWLPYIDTEVDLAFLEKSLLNNTTNSILFRLAMSCIDNLNFNLDCKKTSKAILKKKQANETKWSNSIDSGQIVKIKLSIILFELHSRLSIYNYFSNNTSNKNQSSQDSQPSASSTNDLPVGQSSSDAKTLFPQPHDNETPFLNSIHKDELLLHYQKLAKEKRVQLVNWIWSTIYKMNLFIQIDTHSQFLYDLEELSLLYSSKEIKRHSISSFHIPNTYLTKFYQIYLSHQANQHQIMEICLILHQQNHLENDQQQLQSNESQAFQLQPIQLILQPKCPLESYFRLVYSRSGHELFYLFDHAVELIQTILNSHKKNTHQSQLAYFMSFDWFEKIIFKHICHSSDLAAQFRKYKQANQQKLSSLLLTIFNSFANHQQANQIIEVYCSKIYKRLASFEKIKRSSNKQAKRQQLDVKLNSYLYIWIELFMLSIKCWHKFKNIVKVIDFLISYSFNNQINKSRESNLLNSKGSQIPTTTFDLLINQSLLDELMTYVKIDFGFTVPQQQQLSTTNNSNSNASELSSTSISASGPNNLISTWLQPSLGWLSNSLTSVVSATANQISGTVGAAIGVSSNSTSTSNNDFESSHQHHLTYDKRLYKECPFIGFYLCLCEERIEAELSLWSTFRLHLLSGSDGTANEKENSVTFIDSCWRKTLSSVNKTHNLNLSFPPQRLMLFKWVERALDLPLDHPLLIIYWQKFFDIYLEKDYYSSLTSRNVLMGTNHSSNSSEQDAFDMELKDTSQQINQKMQSPTFKLFTSTSQLNSLLKQMKKQLEMTSEHYAYESINKAATSSNDRQQPVASVSNYHFNEFISKLYYALSLWVDETRLHDPHLYLPALPAHYEPNLLAKIFSKQNDLWLQYIDLNKLNLNLEKTVQLGFKNDPKIETNFSTRDLFSSKITSNDKLSHLENNKSAGLFFFRQPDRLVIFSPSNAQLNLRFNCALKEKFGSSIEKLLNIENATSNKTSKISLSAVSKDELQLIVNICEHLIRNIFKYNKEVINHSLNHMLKLDEKLTNKLLIHLWHNEMCEKYVQVPCTSLLNPMHQCTRPAMVKFVYEIATKRDQFRHEIKQNRINHDKLISNLIEYSRTNDQNEINRFPNDDIIKSMVAMNQLIKKLLRNHHIYLQNTKQSGGGYNSTDHQNTNQMLLTRLFYLLIDLYETQMTHPNDVLNSLKNPSPSSLLPTISTSSTAEDKESIIEQQSLTDSIHLYMFDLIHLIGSNFIQQQPQYELTNVENTIQLRKRNQQILLEKIIQKLTSTLSLSNIVDTSQPNTQPSSSALKRQNNILLNLTRNKLLLMSLCAQYVEPDDLDLFNEFYMNILCSITSILLNESSSNSAQASVQANSDSTEMINQKFAIILQLLAKFSINNLKKLLDEAANQTNINEITQTVCSMFVETNINFLMDLKFDFLVNVEPTYEPLDIQIEQVQQLKQRQKVKEENLKLVIEQCIDNFVSILSLNYPFYFEYMLKKCLDFSSSQLTSKYGAKHLNKLNIIFQQQEKAYLFSNSQKLTREKFLFTFEFLNEYFLSERSKFRSQKRSFYSHWCLYARQLADFYSNFFITYFEKFVMKNLTSIDKFESKFQEIWELLVKFYSIWIDTLSVKEVTTQSLINVNEVYETEIALVGVREINNSLNIASPGAAVLCFFDSFLFTFHTILEHLNVLLDQNAKNFALNKLFHYYYEQIASNLQETSSVNDNTLDCYHRCLSKYSSTWFGKGQFEPDYQSINIMMELCLVSNTRLVKHLAFNLVCYLDFNFICESYFRKMEIMPIQINDLLKCWLQLLAEFCLRDQVRESAQFDALLRPVYNQAEVLQCWSMLSDTSYADVVLKRFCTCADYRYAFASRGTDRGLLMNLLKSSAEFYSLADRNSLSCFSSAKRRCFLKAVCHLLLKPSLQTIKQDNESFQNCIMNLLTDIETFSISAVSSTIEDSSINKSSLKHEIQLLIDECICLITNSEAYKYMFELWISSSKDSPILVHFINRISRSYDLYSASPTSESYCNLLELCLDVYFETDRSMVNEQEVSRDKRSLIMMQLLKDVNENSPGWKPILEEIEFKLTSPSRSRTNSNILNSESNSADVSSSSNSDLFEFKCLQHSSYLLLLSYMSQRFAILKATHSTNPNEFLNSLINYTGQVLSSFFNANNIKSKPKSAKEEKFILISNKLIEFYIFVLINPSVTNMQRSKVGEQIIKLSSLLVFYGEDTLSNPNPLNESGQSIGSDLLASIGLNILAKKSPFSLEFRFYSRCMAICLLKQILIISAQPHKEEEATNNLFPDLLKASDNSKSSSSEIMYFYKVRLSHEDKSNINDLNTENLILNSTTTNLNKLSSSLPSSTMSFSPPSNARISNASREMINSFNQLLKQAAYQFHLIFQTKAYYNNSHLVDLANYTNQQLQNSTNSLYFCLPQVFNMSTYLCSQLFKEKFYLF